MPATLEQLGPSALAAISKRVQAGKHYMQLLSDEKHRGNVKCQR